jgi:calcineurin-like phosphoesterase family protein
MKIFVTSDLHFGHKNIIKYENRPYENIEQMDYDYMKIWNKQVNNDDLIYVLGDFSWYKGKKTNEILKQLNGRKILIIGNHDKNFLDDTKFDKTLFEEITYYKEINSNKTKIIMCHYPIADWNLKSNGSIHLYGHVHSMKNETTDFMNTQKNSYNVGIDIWGKLKELEDFIIK